MSPNEGHISEKRVDVEIDDAMKRGAKFSADRRYRYALWRIWNESQKIVLFIGLNPSMADETKDDPTIRRCCQFVKDWGYGGMVMVNLFAFCATDFRDLKAAIDPVGAETDRWIQSPCQEAAVVVAVWGNHGAYHNRAQIIRQRIPELWCISMNVTGEPAHPLYLKKTAQLQRLPLGAKS